MEKSDNITKKRTDYISWSDYFMALALLAAKRSKDPKCQVGACIVNEEKRIVGIGYNGFPNGCSDDDFPWGKGTEDNEEDNKHLYVCHAEMNAVINKNVPDVKGCTIYVGLFPCNECAKVIIQSGIKKVVFLSDEKRDKIQYQASKRMLKAAGVECSLFKSEVQQIVINFTGPTLSDSTLQSDMEKFKLNETL